MILYHGLIIPSWSIDNWFELEFTDGLIYDSEDVFLDWLHINYLLVYFGHTNRTTIYILNEFGTMVKNHILHSLSYRSILRASTTMAPNLIHPIHRVTHGLHRTIVDDDWTIDE